MRCIFCSKERSPSLEHVFPSAIGGTVTTDRVCASCNSELGSRVDAALCDFLPVRMRRAKLNLVGNSGVAPAWYEIFLGEGKLVGESAGRIQTTFDKMTGKLVHRKLHHATDVILPDGQKVRRVTVDIQDKEQIPKIIQRERKRHGLPPLSENELVIEARKSTVETIEQPNLLMDVQVSFAYLQHAVLKIAYELAFLWLGEAYLDDPLAASLRAAILSTDLASADAHASTTHDVKECGTFRAFFF